MENKRKDLKKIIQWLAFAVAIVTTLFYLLVFATDLGREMTMENINTLVIIGYLIAIILIISSYIINKKR